MPFAKLASLVTSCSSQSLPISYSTLDSNRYSVKIRSLLAPIYASSSSSPAREFENPLPKVLNSSPNLTPPKIHFKSNQGTNPIHERRKNLETSAPTMSEIMDSSRAQNLDLKLQTFGPFFRITAKSLKTQMELGRAEGVIRFWFGGKILHLDSIRLQRETLGMEKSIFGIGLFIGAVAIRHGYESGCNRAELLAINDTDLYHSKLVRFYTRIGFRTVYEVTGSSVGDLSHMLVWGGVGTRMDANVEELMIKWCSRFKTKTSIELPS